MVKLAVIGLDGATFDILNPLIADGRLPYLGKLLKEGSWGYLHSTFPPVSAAAWTSVATGKNPGKTGVFDFLNPTVKGGLELKAWNSSAIRKSGAYWDYLSQAGFKVGILNFPGLFPPYPINGYMVGGLGSFLDRDFTYPRELKDELFSHCNGYEVHIHWNSPRYAHRSSAFVSDVMRLLNINKKAVELFLSRDIDILTVVISATDFMQHFMWKYLDEAHPCFQRQAAEHYRPLFDQMWQQVDDIVGRVMEGIDEKGNILVVSDHGFGPHSQSFFTNSWLEGEGYLHRAWRPSGILWDIRRSLTKIWTLAPRPMRDKVRWMARARPASFIQQVDMTRTLAFANIHDPSTGRIFLSPAIDSASERGRLGEEITDRLEEVCSQLGITVVVRHREDLYSGPYLELAPDIIFALNDFSCSVDYTFNKSIFRSPAPNTSFSGSHRGEGILIAQGGDFDVGGRIEGAQVYDIAPTVLHLLGLPVPEDMDGQVLKELFKKGSVAATRGISHQAVGERELIRRRVRELKKQGKLLM
ncbi:MAG: alkaline phosphatase family protein [Chloroflexi bacterium]|nr:alkaline phosphatase family protein [Chloroflexota bacterium]